MRRDGSSERFWQLSFGKRPAEEMFDVGSDAECLHNLAAEAGYEKLKDEMSKQLMRELKQQQDPRMFGQGHVFDEYTYANEGTRNFYERFTSGEKFRAGWVNESDFEKEPLD